MLDILLLILIMCLVWSTYNKTAFLFYILLQFAKIATYIFVFAYICKYSAFLRPSVYKIQCNFESGSVKFSVILKTNLATLILTWEITEDMTWVSYMNHNLTSNCNVMVYKSNWRMLKQFSMWKFYLKIF